ncbi:MAG: 3-hydroxyacyl-CoA dehydrogenase family protein [Solirubrobacterales bacterium]
MGSGFPERVGIVGAGTIACGLAACVVESGGEVVLWARSAGSARRAREEVAAEEQLTVTTDLEGLAATTLTVEAVAEQQYLKRDLLASLRALLPEEAILSTTTSSLRVSELATASGDPARFFGLHVFNPVRRMPLVEVCFPDQAGGTLRARAGAFCEAIGKTAVEVPDEPGFVVNRLLFPYLFDAVRLLERTGMKPEQVDACMKLGASHPMGPLELLDLVGIDVADAIGEALHADTGDPAHHPPGRIKELVRQGRLGRKAGAGFYSY